MKLSEKVKGRREALTLTQQQLADLAGISKRSVAAYETEEAKPRAGVLPALAAALQVSTDYLTHDELTDPAAGLAERDCVERVRREYGEQGAREMDALLARTCAMFAGGALSEEAKDYFFMALMKAYLTCKDKQGAVPSGASEETRGG